MAITLASLGKFTGTGAEIAGFDPLTQRTFVVSGSATLQIIDTSTPQNPQLFGTIDTSAFGTANSVAVKDGLVAIAVENANKVLPGSVLFYDVDGNFLNRVEVGALPDMLTFTPDGKRILTANEGEPTSYGQADSIDPEGSISIIDLSNGVLALTQSNVTTTNFQSFNSQQAALIAQDVRIYGPGSTVAQDLEPEYIAVSNDNKTAWITLQENNALAVLDIASGQITAIKSLGFKDHNTTGNGLDASDRDGPSNTGRINIQNWSVLGMYQPDAIASFTVGGQTYLITANEGDAREYTGLTEEVRVGNNSYVLNPTAFPNAATLKQNANLGRLTVTNRLGDTDGDGDFDKIYALGARSFTIWTTAGDRVFDSGDQLEQITATQVPTLFNSNGDAATFDTRSDNKGPEPEGVVIGVINERTYAFIGLERTGGVIVYDITTPTAPTFVQYINTPGDVSPEGLAFVPADRSPTGESLLIVTNELSDTTTYYKVTATNGQGNKTVVNGTPGNDRLQIRDSNVIVYGLAGNDTIQANRGSNNLFGGAGNDTLNSGNSDDIVNGGDGNDDINANNGKNLVYGGTGNDRIDTGNDDDVIYGGDGNDQINAGAGVNTILAGAGDDIIRAGNRSDRIDAGAGSDRIFAGNGTNFIIGGRGNDEIRLGTGQNTIVLATGEGTDNIFGFRANRTQIGLTGDLIFADLTIAQSQGDTSIQLTATGEVLAVLQNTRANTVTANTFIKL